MRFDYSRELLRTGIMEAKIGQKDAARRYLDRAIYITTAYDELAEAWFWMSQVVDDVAEKRKALENCLSHDLHHARARRALAILDGKLKADDVIDPNHLPLAPEGLRTSDAQRFMCPKCGARMAFAPDGGGLVCDYCTNQSALGLHKNNTEKDFIVAMATMKGHGKPLQEQAFHCNGCGAEFILPPKQISSSCAYCDSPHVINIEKTKDLLAPDTILPFAFDQKRATKYLIDWVEKNKITPEKKVDLPRGLYVPLWTFDIGGAIDYTGEYVETQENEFFGEHEQRKIVQIKDEFPVMADDVTVPASRKLSSVFLKLIPTFDIKHLQPYDPRFLASWLAEIYDIPMADASLDARSIAYKKFKDDLPSLLHNTKIVHTSSAKISIESFKLNLLPVWMTEIPFSGREHLVLINGQNGAVMSDIEWAQETESGGLLSWLGDLLEE